MSHIRKRSFATLALATMLGGLSTFAVASPAAAAGANCDGRWSDKNTFGVSCTYWGSGRFEYWAHAKCSNGRSYDGPAVTTGWSYVYCSTHGATYVPGTGEARSSELREPDFGN